MHNPALRAECAAVVDFFINATALIFRLLRAAAGLYIRVCCGAKTTIF